MRHLIFISLFCLGLVALGKSQQTFQVSQSRAIKKISQQVEAEKNKSNSLPEYEQFDSLQNRRYGEAKFSGIVMSHRRIQEAGGVTNCFVTVRVVNIENNKYQPIPGLKRGDIVQHVLDTPLCELRTGSRAKGLLIDNNYFVEGRRGLMIEI